jgi:serine/threonine-protein kinase
VSRGPEAINVPNVLGKPRNEATKILRDAGFKVRAFGPGNFTVQAQTPSSDKKAKVGSTVTLAGF